MPSSRLPSARRGLALTLGLGLAAGGLLANPAPAVANPAGSNFVISEVYGGGGNSGGLFRSDFIELYNPTSGPLSLSGMSIQYRASSGNAGGAAVALSGTVGAGKHFLIKAADGTNTAQPALPTPDATTTFTMSGTSGQVLLINGSSFTGSGNVAGNASLVDMVGYGGTTATNNTYEAAPSVAASNSTSVARAATGADTDSNAADFTAGAPTPTNSGGVDPDPDPDPEPTERTIPEIQGDGAASPFVGEPVTTQGVVTAAYPAGLFGFYVQTPGTGGETDPAAPGASDGVFVRYPFGSGSVTVEPGDHVEVTGVVTEFAGQTQLEIAQAATDVAVLTETAAPVTPTTTTAWPATDAEKEGLEGMLYTPTRDFTVTNVFGTNRFGEVGLALGDRPLIQPTEVADAQDAAAIAAVTADNAARAIVLDDAAGGNYATSGTTPAYVSNDEPVRVGAPTTFTDDVILTQGGSPSSPTYRFQPLETVVGPENLQSPATFENTRTAAPDEAFINETGNADIEVASFNVLNYFTTLGDPDNDNVGNGGCTAFNDRDGDGNNVRGGCDQRGAWDPEDFERQQEKIVAAINTLDADVVGLMEIENSAALGEQADEATNTLVDALNADAGSEVWAANPSSAELPPTSEQDVISNAIIYKPASVTRTGEARAFGEQSGEGEAFGNAREPIAQVFTPVGGGEEFLVVVNHFKSKGSGTNDGTGQGNANPDRVRQAEALRDWVPTVQDDTGTESVLLVGDFNSYTEEDPLQVLYEADYTNVEKFSEHGEYSYSFSGLSGSLDHILANQAAMESYTGTDIWDINGGESLALEYSRYNNHATDFHRPDPFRSSDHSPVVMGLDLVDDVEEPELLPAEIKVTVTPKKVTVDKTRAKVRVTVTSEGTTPTGSVEINVEGKGTEVVELDDKGRADLRLSTFGQAGTKTITVRYSGDDEVQPETIESAFNVREKKGKKGKGRN